MAALSLVTEQSPDAELVGLTYASITPEQKAEVRASWNGWDIFHTSITNGVIVVVCIYFW